MRNLPVFLIFLAAPACACAQAGWSVYPQFAEPGLRGLAVADLDASGVDEVVVSAGRTALAVYANDVTGWRVQQVRALGAGEVLTGRLVRVPATAGTPVRIAASVDEGATRALHVFEGPALTRVARIPLHGNAHAVADVDADGGLDLVALAGQSNIDFNAPLLVRTLAGEPRWSGPASRVGDRLAVGQLDADAALEIVLGEVSGNAQGNAYVVDAASQVLAWSNASGPSGIPLVGEFDPMTPGAEFALVHRDGPARVFAARPDFVLVATHDVQAAADAVARDLDGDGVDDIVVAADGAVRAFAGDDGSLVVEHLFPVEGLRAVDVGQLDGDPALEIVAAGGAANGAGGVFVLDAASGQAELAQLDEAGPHVNLVRADLDADGDEEVAFTTRDAQGPGSSLGANLIVLDADTGVEVARRDNVSTPLGDHAGARLAAANLDGDAALELVVAGAQGTRLQVHAIDGATLATQWTHVGDDGPARLLRVAPLHDGATPDVVLWSGGLLRVLSGATGAPAWTAMPDSLALSLDVVELDGDDGRELLVGGLDWLTAQDVGANRHHWRLNVGTASLHHAVEGLGPACRVVRYEPDRLERRRCDTGAVESVRAYPTAVMVRPLRDSHGTLLISDGARLRFIGRHREVEPPTPERWPGLALDDLADVSPEGERLTVIAGSTYGVHRVDIALTEVFGTGFE